MIINLREFAIVFIECEGFIMTSCFPVVIGKSCLRLRNLFCRCLSRPIVGALMMERKYSLYIYTCIYIHVLLRFKIFF